ncbi:MAG TPA: PPOX class F420-dependent oxidoreductase [Actinoplanes sp.]|jgi:PPOX class probable F420-dependent enzyme|nr:PPOX class F420-dependent oxidoreductase [Actinoplanes sp.]
MSRGEAMAFLAEGTRTGKLATASRTGAPHVAPLWFVVAGDDLVFTTGRDSVKARHLRANPRAALAVDVEAFPYHFVVARGPVRVEDDAADLLTWTTTIAARYVPPGRAEEYGRVHAEAGELLCRLGGEHVTGARDVVA